MGRDRQLQKETAIRELYDKLLGEGKYRTDYILREVAARFYISERTVEAILWGEYDKRRSVSQRGSDPNQTSLFVLAA